MNKKLGISSSILNILLGAFMFVFGEVDDSPGGQLIGAIAVGVGIAGLISSRKKAGSNVVH